MPGGWANRDCSSSHPSPSRRQQGHQLSQRTATWKRRKRPAQQIEVIATASEQNLSRMESGAGIGSSPTDAPAGADSKASRNDLMVALEQVAVNQQAEVDERLSEVYRMIHNMITVVQEFDRS